MADGFLTRGGGVDIIQWQGDFDEFSGDLINCIKTPEFRHDWLHAGLFIQHSLPVDKRDAVHPSHVGLYGTTVPYAVLHDYVTGRHHLA